MVELYVPVAPCDIPEFVNGVQARLVVSYVCGSVREYSGPIGSVSLLFRSLRACLRRDLSISCVRVFLPSGRLLCSCQRFS